MSTEVNENSKNYALQNLGEMSGHNGWVTSIKSTVDPNVILSSSRDKTIIVWQVLDEGEELYGKPFRRLYGHEHFVEDVQVSSDGLYALSGSWDKTMRLWNLESGECVSRFVKHKNDVMAVSFSADNRQILREHNYTIEDKLNPEWITCAAFSPKRNPSPEEKAAEIAGDSSAAPHKSSDHKNTADSISQATHQTNPQATSQEQTNPDEQTNPQETPSTDLNFLLYGSFNGSVQKFNFDSRKVEYTFSGHSSPVTALSISPDASLCASGSKDGSVILWELRNGSEMRRKTLEGPVVSLKFNPSKYWLCGTTETEMKVWDLYERSLVSHEKFSEETKCTSVEWGQDSMTLLFGFADGKIRAMKVVEAELYHEEPAESVGEFSEEGERVTDYTTE